MSRVHAIFKREFMSYFKSPIGYVVLAMFMLISAFVFVTQLQNQYSDIATVLVLVQFVIFLIAIPMITMRSFSEERKNGSEILLLTSPASVFEIVLGKYLASFSILLIMAAGSVVYIVITLIFGGMIDEKIIGAYIAFIGLGAVYISIGLLASSVTENQVISAIITFGSILFLMLLDGVAQIMGYVTSMLLDKVNVLNLTDLQIDTFSKSVVSVIKWPNPLSRVDNYSNGIFEVSPIILFISLIAIFLFLTIRMIEKRRWTQK
jgi:ABC-2 type transport system permease protein